MIKLPSHPESKIADPLSILDSDEVLVPYWDFLTTLLRPFIEASRTHEAPDNRLSKFIEALGTICYSLTGNGSQDFTLLLESSSATRLVGPIITNALNMKELFPDGTLQTLGNSENLQVGVPKGEGFLPSMGTIDTITLNQPQVLCLVCHMVLGTFSKPPWMTWDGPNLGSVWFADDGKGDQKIKRAYIQVLLAYLEEELTSGHAMQLAGESNEIPKLSFSIFDVHAPCGGSIDKRDQSLPQLGVPESAPSPLIPLNIYLMEEEDDDYGPCFTTSSDVQICEEVCQLVSANKEIGFGPAATQEERIFGSNPALLPSILMTPPLSVTQSLIITGDTQVYGHLTGHLRSARLREIYTCADRGTQSRTGRSFLFLDALEMDGERHGRDIEMENMLREIDKLMSGFNALLHSKAKSLSDDHSAGERRFVVVLPPWGCGTFGGDFKVKLLLIWMAASMCGISELRFAVKSAWWNALDADWRGLIDRVRTTEDPGNIWDFFEASASLSYERGDSHSTQVQTYHANWLPWSGDFNTGSTYNPLSYLKTSYIWNWDNISGWKNFSGVTSTTTSKTSTSTTKTTTSTANTSTSSSSGVTQRTYSGGASWTGPTTGTADSTFVPTSPSWYYQRLQQ